MDTFGSLKDRIRLIFKRTQSQSLLPLRQWPTATAHAADTLNK